MDDLYVVMGDVALREQYYRSLAKAKIEACYPIEKQLNVLNSESDVERRKMRRYIDACRAWSNQDNPVLADLDAIQP